MTATERLTVSFSKAQMRFLKREAKRDKVSLSEILRQIVDAQITPPIYTIDPEILRVKFTPDKTAEIFGDVKKGTWVDDTMLFPTPGEKQ